MFIKHGSFELPCGPPTQMFSLLANYSSGLCRRVHTEMIDTRLTFLTITALFTNIAISQKTYTL